MTSSQAGGGRVLLADDDPAVLRGASLVLAKHGFEVDAVASGQEAAEALARIRYDALVADINMPGNEQLELLQVRAGQGALVPVILVTGHPSLETALGALRHGVVDYVTKPLHPEELVARVAAAVQKGRALRSLDDARQRAAALIEAVGALEAAVTLMGFPSPGQCGARGPSTHRDPLQQLPPADFERLSPRERDVVRLLAVGNTVQETAKALRLSTNTVRNHIKSVFSKLRVRSQVALLGKLAGHASPDERKA